MKIVVADASHIKFATVISETITESAKVRGTGIAKRTPEYIIQRLKNGNAVIAIDGDRFAGFCYIEVWSHQKYVANSGLIVHPDYRKQGLAKKIKKAVFELSRRKFPEAKLFGITTGLAVMKINSDLGYRPVTYSELTDDPQFWKGCQTCKNFDILTRTNRNMCLCTGMLYDPKQTPEEAPSRFDKKSMERLKQIRRSLLSKKKNP
ncbi:GNAT family N-acetyltransferase [Robiginitalea aurantiaca]|uniref:GNAT family N-acetyltransferase n=1 Tax=Robiginitalea aurantiaca TaxID=3056915 RepID=A0ABT7WEU2_9FLAO|nr:GNAT family N-acetyltransferase [Robiginitalea aurantiaca]MDM9631440.1 GNAT family N-acetyltransferase [Robiginitalea aurantiaca]